MSEKDPKADSVPSPGGNAPSGETSESTEGPGPAPKGVSGVADTATSLAVTPELLPPEQNRARTAMKKTKAAERNLAVVQRLDRGVRNDATRVVRAAFKAADVDTLGPKPEGWTDRDYRIAQDARLSTREAPKYLDMAQKMLDTYKKAEAMQDRDPSPVLNCDIQVFVQQNQYNYEIQDAEDK